MSFALAAPSGAPGPNAPTSQIFAEKVDIDGQGTTPIHHVGGGVALLVLAVIGIGYLNHRANR